MSTLEFVTSIKIVDRESLRLYLQSRLDVLTDYIQDCDSLQSIEVYSAAAEELRVLLRKTL